MSICDARRPCYLVQKSLAATLYILPNLEPEIGVQHDEPVVGEDPVVEGRHHEEVVRVFLGRLGGGGEVAAEAQDVRDEPGGDDPQ